MKGREHLGHTREETGLPQELDAASPVLAAARILERMSVDQRVIQVEDDSS